MYDSMYSSHNTTNHWWSSRHALQSAVRAVHSLSFTVYTPDVQTADAATKTRIDVRVYFFFVCVLWYYLVLLAFVVAGQFSSDGHLEQEITKITVIHSYINTSLFKK